MSNAYRDAANPTIDCPRCGELLPGGELSCCTAGCGVWVPIAFAMTALEPIERAVSRVADWWRPLVTCPHCSEAMTRRGHYMVPFQGCDEHGFWIDDENVGQTGLARRTFAPVLDAARKRARSIGEERKRARIVEEERARVAAEEARARKAALRREEEEAHRAEAEQRAARERACQPYLDLVRSAMEGGDPLPLAERLMKLEDMIRALRESR